MNPVVGFLMDKVFPGLIGTGVGAWLAFWSKRRMDQCDEAKRQKAAGNFALFTLIQQTNELIRVFPAGLPDLSRGC